VAYAAPPGCRPLELDLHLPAPGADPPPVVVFVHGGGWATGDRRWLGPTPFADLVGDLTRAGLAVAAVDHRLSSEATWPAPRDDVRAAVRFLRARAAALGVDAARLGLWGESAGGHLALAVAVSEDPLDAGPRPAAVVSWYAPVDLAEVASDGGGDPDGPDAATSREARLLGRPVGADPVLTADASPARHVDPAAAGATSFLLLHGEGDRFVPVRQVARMERALTTAGVPVRVRTWPGADHLWAGSPAVAAEALAETVGFLSDHLG
jgi:acetyl esterase/lipase